ncbi:MAG: hypothetical protein M3128_05630 [Verrucomicrobiota bacterium]|nr:hypothetical protein [Verrucomicrobiota bacterium]
MKSRPVSAQIVWGHDRVADEGHDGDVRVIFASGKHQRWTRNGKCLQPRVSNSGLVGWTHGKAYHSKGALMNATLVLARGNKILRRIAAYYPFIEVWDFTEHDTRVVMLSRGPHGPGRLEKFRIKDGAFLDGCFESRSEEWPKWARSFVEKTSAEGTYLE